LQDFTGFPSSLAVFLNGGYKADFLKASWTYVYVNSPEGFKSYVTPMQLKKSRFVAAVWVQNSHLTIQQKDGEIYRILNLFC
jgi:hypothetical protein